MKLRRKELSDDEKAARAERIDAELNRNGAPDTGDAQREFLELYKMMVASSEALVARRQGVNTFFLTINGLLPTAIGLLVKTGGRVRLQAGGIFVLALLGIMLCYAWRSLLISFGQLNTGKFAIIGRMERRLAAPIYSAEWEALGRGEDKRVYRSFTAREASVPVVLGIVYLLAAVLSLAVWLGIWTL